jgi:NAD(P)-dependent dehydrogenase (short-subunit alcohol dehydrogenase family)
MGQISFDGRVAIVTGAGGGLGRTYALDLAQRGCKVVVNDVGGSVTGGGVNNALAQRVVDEILAAGGQAVPNFDSVSTPDGGESIVNTALDTFAKVDIVINNAGMLRNKTIAKMSWDDLDAVLDVHLKAAFYVSQPAFKVMRDNEYGRFVFTSSNSGVFGNFGQSNYGAAKMGVIGLSNVLAIEGRRHNILSNAICPVASTRMTEELLGGFADALAPERVTALAVYLASEQSCITHGVFSAGGGRFARMFIGLAPGWYAGRESDPTAEDIAQHLPEIDAHDGYTTPTSNGEELGQLLVLLHR